MRLRQLSNIWWRDIYPYEHLEMMAYVEARTQQGVPWQQSVLHTFSKNPEALPVGIQRLCRELGRRMFELSPSFRLGDGVTLVSQYGRFPGTIIGLGQRTVTAQQNLIVRDAKQERALYLQDTDAPKFQFSKRTTGEWLVCGSRSPSPRLMYGRSVNMPVRKT